ncbi:MAG: CvpA family protein [Planctomycetota bacterium]|nr:CvpA family protein [Planctomycetota bacterium]
MNLLDYAIIFFLALWLLRGYFTGFSLTLTSFLGIVCGVVAAVLFSPYLGQMLEEYIDSKMVCQLLAYFAIFFVVSSTFRILGLIMRKALVKMKLRDIDSYMGAMVSLLEASLITVVIIMLVMLTPWDGGHKLVGESRIAKVMLSGALLLSSNLPEDIREKLEPRIEDARSARLKQGPDEISAEFALSNDREPKSAVQPG